MVGFPSAFLPVRVGPCGAGGAGHWPGRRGHRSPPLKQVSPAPTHPCWVSGTPSVKRASIRCAAFQKPLMLTQELDVSNGHTDTQTTLIGARRSLGMCYALGAGRAPPNRLGLETGTVGTRPFDSSRLGQRYQLTAQMPRRAESAESPHAASDPLVPARRHCTAATGSNSVGTSPSPSPTVGGHAHPSA